MRFNSILNLKAKPADTRGDLEREIFMNLEEQAEQQLWAQQEE